MSLAGKLEIKKKGAITNLYDSINQNYIISFTVNSYNHIHKGMLIQARNQTENRERE
jgi:hypothetical protein